MKKLAHKRGISAGDRETAFIASCSVDGVRFCLTSYSVFWAHIGYLPRLGRMLLIIIGTS